jgi:anti-sigma regulatory factor (Ser/Thr protein kinase)
MKSASKILPPEPTSARACRRFITTTLDEWGADAVADDAALLSSELVTNAVLHARTEIRVEILLDEGVLRVEVHDLDPRLPSVRSYSVMSGTGRGLSLVEHTAESWSAEALPDGGKKVWFELREATG